MANNVENYVGKVGFDNSTTEAYPQLNQCYQRLLYKPKSMDI